MKIRLHYFEMINLSQHIYIITINIIAFVVAMLLSPSVHAQTVGNALVFSYTGADQTYIVPTGVTLLQVESWGAGRRNYGIGFGGAGGFAGGMLTLTSGEILTVIVGGGGPGGGHFGTTTGSYGGGVSVAETTILAAAADQLSTRLVQNS